MVGRSLDLNCDMGESYGPYTLGMDEQVMPLISSANVGCGFHGGDPHVMRRTVELAKRWGAGVGAHPGLPDLLGFGRREMKVTPDEVWDFFVYQIGALKAFTEAAGLRLRHVKPHGALLFMALDDEALARAMCDAVAAVDPGLVWLTHSGLRTVDIGRERGLTVVQEVYADRAYHPDKRLVSRRIAGAVIKDPLRVAACIERLLTDGTLETIEGRIIELEFDSIAVHGDTAGALEEIRVIREILDRHGVAVRPLGQAT